mmetsp:Transcript_7253/g.27157  ORF Transcript_7253/g.27157 Transcript_7253/m.27157 type:complete len:99 (-) Transcript_7253:1620-1916(-)
MYNIVSLSVQVSLLHVVKRLSHISIRIEVFHHSAEEIISSQCGGIPDDAHVPSCSGDCHISSSFVTEESYLTLLVGTHQTYNDGLLFSALIRIDSVNL